MVQSNKMALPPKPLVDPRCENYTRMLSNTDLIELLTEDEKRASYQQEDGGNDTKCLLIDIDHDDNGIEIVINRLKQLKSEIEEAIELASGESVLGASFFLDHDSQLQVNVIRKSDTNWKDIGSTTYFRTLWSEHLQALNAWKNQVKTLQDYADEYGLETYTMDIPPKPVDVTVRPRPFYTIGHIHDAHKGCAGPTAYFSNMMREEGDDYFNGDCAIYEWIGTGDDDHRIIYTWHIGEGTWKPV